MWISRVHAAALMVLMTLGCSAGLAAAAEPPRVLAVGEKPESVCRGFASRLYVTMINGEEPGDGQVVCVDGDRVSEFCSGLNSPKGIAYVGGVLVVADETTLWKIDSGGHKTPIAARDNFPEPVEFLNDVAASADGRSVYVAEMSTPAPMFDPDGERRLWERGGDKEANLPRKGRIYRVTLTGEITQVIPPGDEALRFPNGVAVEGPADQEQVYAADFFTGNIVWMAEGRLQVLKTGLRGLDGITPVGDVFYGSSWTQGKVWKISRRDGSSTVLLEGLTTAADFFHDEAGRQLIVPDMIAGTLTFLPLNQK
jgi:hypothetical protein